MGTERRSAGRRRRRAWLVAGSAVLVLLLVAWQVLERIVRVERYRPQIEQEIGILTGLPVAIASLDLAWRPIPCLSAIDVRVGEGDFEARASRLDIFPLLPALLWRKLEIFDVRIHDLVITVPADTDATVSAWDALWAHLEPAFAPGAPSSAGFIDSVEVKRIRARDLALHWGAGADAVVRADVVVEGVTGHAITIDVKAEAPALLRASGQLAIDTSGAAGARITLQGTLDPEPAGESALAGSFQGKARLGGEGPADAELAFTGQGLSLAGSADFGEKGVLRVDSIHAAGPALAALLDFAEGGAVDLRPGPGASLDARNLRVALSPGTSPRPIAGTLALRGLHVGWGSETLADDLRADARFEAGAIEIESLQAGPVALTGRVAPEADWSRFELALSGRLDLSDGLLHALGVPEAVRDVRGEVEIEELTGSFPPAPEREPVVVRARLSGGSLRVASEALDDTFSGIALQLTSQERSVQVEGNADSGRFGALEVSAAIDPDARSARGDLVIDAEAVGSLISDATTLERVKPMLQRYGRSRIAFRVAPDAGSADVFQVKLERSGAPRLEAAFALRTDEKDALGDIDATADLPSEALRGLLPEGARTAGTAHMLLRRTIADRAFSVAIDLGDVSLATGRFVDKASGEPLTVRVERSAEKGAFSWMPRQVVFESRTARLVIPLDDGTPVISDLDVDLADWSFLLVDSARASGHVRGSFDLHTPVVQLQLSDVALRFSPDLGVDAINGAVALDDGAWSVRDLHLRSGQSDAALTASLRDHHLEGELTGAYLDADFVRALAVEIDALRPEPEEPSPPLSGAFAVKLDRVGYGRSEAQHLQAQIALSEGDVAVRDLAFEAYDGKVTGTVDIDAREGEPSQLTLALDIANIAGRFLDDALASEKRDIGGRFSGTLHFEAPLLDGLKAMLPKASGELVASGVDGTFGRLGLATQLVTVLRSTEALRLRMPSFRDEGLVFDTTQAFLGLKEGLLRVRRFDLESTTYAVSAEGEVDFRTEVSKIPIEVNAIRGLTGLVEWIPIAGDALQLANVRLVATGSPYDLRVGVASIQDQLIGVGMVGPRAVIKGVGDVMRILRPKKKKEEAESTPSAAPPVEVAVPPAPPTSPSPAPSSSPAPETPSTPEDAPAREGPEVSPETEAPGSEAAGTEGAAMEAAEPATPAPAPEAPASDLDAPAGDPGEIPPG